jgi:YrbI family 3-deoxy-D-manno-octulosonate 8-phosphate phosphatase
MEDLKNIKLVVFDFDGVFTNNLVYTDEDGKESVACNRSDGLGLTMLREIHIDMVIISTETNRVVRQRAKKLQIECYHGVENKLNCLRKIAEEKGINMQQIAFLGNDINDLECLQHVGVSAVVADAYPEAKKASKICLTKKGGEGAVREFCEMVYKSKQTR